LDYIINYIKTISLFFWRGLWFSGFWWLSLMLFVALLYGFTFLSLKALAILPLAANLFHLIFTYKMPRYHIIKLGAMLIYLTLMVEQIIDKNFYKNKIKILFSVTKSLSIELKEP